MFKRLKQGVRRIETAALAAALAAGPALATAPPPQPYIADDATELLYHFDEPAGFDAYDFSGHGRTATYYSEAAHNLGAQDFFGQSFQAGDGNTHRTTWTDSGNGQSSILYTAPASGFTLEGWFRTPASFSLPTVNPAVLMAVQPVGTTQQDYELMILPSGDARGALNLVFADKSRFLVWSSVASAPTPWCSSTWYHIAVTVQPNPDGTMKYSLYRSKAGDAAPTLLSSRDDTPMQLASTDTHDRVLSIGNVYGFSGHAYFPGQIDEFRFSSVARSIDDLRASVAPSAADRIRVEALRRYSLIDHPLPLMGSWSPGYTPYYNGVVADEDLKEYGYSPAWQMDRIRAGHHLLPWFATPDPDFDSGTNPGRSARVGAYYGALIDAEELRLPLSFVGPQWEELMYWPSHPWLTAPLADNPNVENLDGSISPTVSAFGALTPWTEVGALWGGSDLMQAVQMLYANPPKVLFLSNNEARRTLWKDNNPGAASKVCGNAHNAACAADIDARAPAFASDDDRRYTVAENWIVRYRMLQAGWNDALGSWKDKSRFIAYGAFGQSSYQRWYEWMNYSLGNNAFGTAPARVDPSPEMWDGGSASLYLSLRDASPTTDFRIQSVQMESMNLVFMLREAMTANPDFWFELSVWDDCDIHDTTHSYCGFFDAQTPAQTYTPARYAAMTQFSMWLLRPRAVRDYRNHAWAKSESIDRYAAVEATVDAVYNNPVLQSFWRNSELVANTSVPHPYIRTPMPAYASENRNFLLENDVDATPYDISELQRAINVYAIARVQGETPHRRWLIYAHAPNGPVATHVTIPKYSYSVSTGTWQSASVNITAAVAGSFYLLTEGQAGTVTATAVAP